MAVEPGRVAGPHASRQSVEREQAETGRNPLTDPELLVRLTRRNTRNRFLGQPRRATADAETDPAGGPPMPPPGFASAGPEKPSAAAPISKSAFFISSLPVVVVM